MHREPIQIRQGLPPVPSGEEPLVELTMKIIRNLNIASKITLLTVTTVVITVGLTTALFIGKMHKELESFATASQESRIKTFWELLRLKGDLKIVNGRMMAGDTVLNDNFDLPDRISEICGGTATIFMNDTRISTNVKKADGSRAVGTKLQGPAYDAVFKEGKSYRGVAPILGVLYFTAYDPIRDAEGKTIGVLYVGVKKAEFLRAFNQLNVIITVAAVLLMALFSGIAMFITRRLLSPISLAVTITEAVAAGDLTVTIPPVAADETGKMLSSLRVMVQSLGGMTGRITQTTDVLQEISRGVTDGAGRVVDAARYQHDKVENASATVIEIAETAREVGEETEKLAKSTAETSSSLMEMASSISEVATNTDKLASLVGEVASAITQSASAAKEIGESAFFLVDASASTASSVGEMEASIRLVEDNARLTAMISKNVEQDAQKGVEAMADMRRGMAEIRESSRITTTVIGSLSARAEEIGAISSVIDEIATKTSLLALNAAIIASQSGEHGKGFGVVADEIKTLAARTARSTEEIAAVIKGVQKETAQAVTVINETEGKIGVGELLCLRSGEALEKIVTGVAQAGEHITGIALTTEEMARSTLLFREAMNKVAEMTKRIGISTSEQARASESIKFAAEKMLELTDQVRYSTSEQSKVGSMIVKAMDEVAIMTSKINRACAEQAKGGRDIAEAVAEINSSANESLQAAKSLKDGASDLSAQVEILHKETGAFRLN